ncbi:hypothetical protein KIL84_007896, partial [Mauremys mutica]
ASYQKQYHTGMLNQDAAQTLIGAAESYVDIIGKFMNIHEVKTYWESKGLLVSFKKLLSDWVYNVKDEKSKPSRNKILKLCHHIVFMDEFEYTSCIITLLNLIPILIDFTHLDETYIKQLKICYYYFISLYILEASLKHGQWPMQWPYWSTWGIPVMMMPLSQYSSVAASEQRLVARPVPGPVPKAYSEVSAEEPVPTPKPPSLPVVETPEINKIMEKNKQDGMKELGLMQCDYPDIVTAVKTKQVVQTVLNTATETLKVLISSGIVDKNEEAKLQKVIKAFQNDSAKKKKNLGTLPSTIAPSTAEELLHSISWLENEKKQIEFIQKRARILCYDYGDIVCEEHEMPEGIHLIISGMTK